MVEPPQWHSTFPLSSLIQLSFWVILIGIVSAGANQAEIRERQISREWPWCEIRQSRSVLHPPGSTVFVNECLTFVVTPLCVHPVKTVKQPIDLRLYQSQLLFNHLQLLHAHYRGRENTKDILNKLRFYFEDVVQCTVISATCITDEMVSFNVNIDNNKTWCLDKDKILCALWSSYWWQKRSRPFVSPLLS